MIGIARADETPVFFRMGSTQRQVIAAMGQPTKITRWSYYYGTSRVDFNPSVLVPVVAGYTIGDTPLKMTGQGFYRKSGIIELIDGSLYLGEGFILSPDPGLRKIQIKEMMLLIDQQISQLESADKE